MEFGEASIVGKTIAIPYLKNKLKLSVGDQLVFQKPLPAKGQGAKRKA